MFVKNNLNPAYLTLIVKSVISTQKTNDFNWNTNKIGSLLCAIFQNHGCETLSLTLTRWPWSLFFIKSYLNSQSHTTCNIIRNGFLVTKIDFVLIVYARSDLDLGIEHVTLMSKYSNYLKKILNSSRNIDIYIYWWWNYKVN